LVAVRGNLPDLRRADLPACRFAERCAHVTGACTGALPSVTTSGHLVRCHHPEAIA
jgi:peptide/nickel transport system ATP-binding protein